MRICIIGKFPPIQGGVSTRTYWTAHALAALGHDVHVVTNAKEVQPPSRMHMRAEDWRRCEARHATGSVTVHWTDPVDGSQTMIPMASPFVSKLAAVAARVHFEYPFDVIYSHYLEPYGVAAHLTAEITRVPHVARMAGSDAGRLWHHPQFEALYDHVLRAAEVVVAAGEVAKRAIERGVASDRIALGGQFVVPEDLFTPDGPALDFAALRAEVEVGPQLRHSAWGEFAGDRPYFGVCGKLGQNKGSFALLAAMERLKRVGFDIGLVALAHGQPSVEKEFRAQVRKLGLGDRVLQIPFLPHWRVPEFLRGCLAVCCLEQDFPIGFHSPIIPLEVLLCGTCLVASTEVIRKLPLHGRLANGYGCVAIEDVNDTEALSSRLAAILHDPSPTRAVGTRGRIFARDLQQRVAFPQPLERVLEAAAARQRVPLSTAGASDVPARAESSENRFHLTGLAEAALQKTGRAPSVDVPVRGPMDLGRARAILAAIKDRTGNGETNLQSLVPAIEIEVAIAVAESEINDANVAHDSLFRLRTRRWAMDENDLAGLVPLREPHLRVLEFDYDVSEFMGMRDPAEFPASPSLRPSHIVAFGCSDQVRNPLMVDGLTARILQLCDGTRTALEVVREVGLECGASPQARYLSWIDSLFMNGLVSLQDVGIGGGSRRSPQPRRR